LTLGLQDKAYLRERKLEPEGKPGAAVTIRNGGLYMQIPAGKAMATVVLVDSILTFDGVEVLS
jgi:hypothetical protein